MTVKQTLSRSGISGKALYARMKQEFDYSQIVWTMVRYNPDMRRERAEELVDAFLQWVALVPSNTAERYVVMFKTPVEEAFHSFVINTRLYEEFCDKFLNGFFHHDPLTEEAGPEVEELAKYTVDRLEGEYEGALHPDLQDWRTLLSAGTYKVACVGPGGHCHL